MRFDEKTEFLKLHTQLKTIEKKIETDCEKRKSLLRRIDSKYRQGAKNLIHYLGLRQLDHKELQMMLARVGLSSLGRCESYVLHNVTQIQMRVCDTLKKYSLEKTCRVKGIDWYQAEKLMHKHSWDLFGAKPLGRHVYIMVTLPSAQEASERWIKDLLSAGTNLIRINCAHETEREWLEVIKRIRKVAHECRVPCKILMDLGGPKVRVAAPSKIVLKTNQIVTLTLKEPTKDNQIQCDNPLVFKNIKSGERILFDDGKIEGQILEVGKAKAKLVITRVPEEKCKLKKEKGINFPDSYLDIPALTEEDFKNLKFISTHADLVGISFVQDVNTLKTLRNTLKAMNRSDLGIILKIETKTGFKNLPKLLFEAMKSYPVGVMIARGDLAVEVGFERLVEVQEEILWLCEAAHVPVIWATQVLENLAKSGLPSRAEVTDAAWSVRAECVMLNKGPYIEKTVRSLDSILRRMELHTYKKRNIFRQLKVAQI